MVVYLIAIFLTYNLLNKIINHLKVVPDTN